MNKGIVTAVNVSGGGVPKLGVGHAAISAAGVAGDRQRDRKHHGGPDRAVCLYSLEVIEALRREGHPITPGSAGENLTVSGLPWDRIVPGAQLRLGSTTLEVTSYTVPCKFIRESFVDGKFERISQKTNPGWSRVYARVLVPGEVSVGDSVAVADT
ncbi:MAG: MOSC domain-containing protein [Gemmatimonadaceae bacterium]